MVVICAGTTGYKLTVDARYQSEELPGVSVFYKDQNGDIYHTYSDYGRGGEEVLAQEAVDLGGGVGELAGRSDELVVELIGHGGIPAGCRQGLPDLCDAA
jgi:hypothetical protein